MARNSTKKKELTKDEKIKKELDKLNRIYKKLDTDTQKATEKLVDNASFLAIVLEELQEHIRINGVKEEYKNGANQFGYKTSVEADLYNKYLKNYMSIVKQLTDLLPKQTMVISEEDDFDDFISNR